VQVSQSVLTADIIFASVESVTPVPKASTPTLAFEKFDGLNPTSALLLARAKIFAVTVLPESAPAVGPAIAALVEDDLLHIVLLPPCRLNDMMPLALVVDDVI
jgi:hypothetical protein